MPPPPFPTHRLLLLHTVCSAYVLLHPSLGQGKASGPATLPRARAAYVGKVGTKEGGVEWLGGQQMASPKASAGVAGGVHACGWKVGSKWRCVRFVRRRSVSESAGFPLERMDGCALVQKNFFWSKSAKTYNRFQH